MTLSTKCPTNQCTYGTNTSVPGKQFFWKAIIDPYLQIINSTIFLPEVHYMAQIPCCCKLSLTLVKKL